MNYLTLVLILAGAVAAVIFLILIGLSRTKKTNQSLHLIGAIGIVERQLNPEGAVIVNGELWRARLHSGSTIWGKERVRVVGVRGHLLLAERENELA